MLGDTWKEERSKARKSNSKALYKGLIVNKLTLKSPQNHHNAGRWKNKKLLDIMAIRVTFLLLISTTIAFSQIKLSGEFCSYTLGEGNVTCISFKPNNQFDYQISGCLGISKIGNGTYILKKQILKLVFANNKQKSKSQFRIVNGESQKETATLEFITTDSNSLYLPAWVIRDSDSKIFQPLSNEANIIIKQVKKNENYQITQIGYEKIKLKLDNKCNKKIFVSIYPMPPSIISNKILKYRLLDINENEFSIGKNITDKYKRMRLK